jgi:hypothetical protein
MEGSRAQKEEEDRQEKAGENSRLRGNEERDDHGYTGQNHRSAETECRHGCDKEDTGAGTKDGHAPPHTANIRGDCNAERGSKNVVRRCTRNGETEDPVDRDVDGVESVEMRKTMTGDIIIRTPGNKHGGKASRLAARLTEVLETTAVRVAALMKTMELKVVGIEISVDKEELRRALASQAHVRFSLLLHST